MLHLFMGALDPLTDASNYEQHGALTPAEMADAFQILLDEYDTFEGVCSMVGTLVLYFGDTPPQGTLECNGAELLIADYPQLAAHLLTIPGDPFEANPESDEYFFLPDYRGMVMMGAGNSGSGANGGNQGLIQGEVSHTLSTGEIPSHNHTEGVVGITGVFVAPGEVPAIVAGASSVTGSTGGGDAHNNLQPSLSVGVAIWYL